MDIKYAKYKYDLDWGEITKEDILQKLYFGKSIKDMNEKEMDQMLEDLLYPNSDVTVTGHSLGGSLSQIVSSVRGCDAVTFNAYGTKDMFKDPASIKEDNIVNYVNEKDYTAPDIEIDIRKRIEAHIFCMLIYINNSHHLQEQTQFCNLNSFSHNIHAIEITKDNTLVYEVLNVATILVLDFR